MENNNVKKELPKYRSINECLEELREIDAGTAITTNFIRSLCKKGKIKYHPSGNKSLVNYTDLLNYLCRE